MQIKRFGANVAGRDLIVGDIHGHFTKLQAALDAVLFDPSRDRLFAVGDLVDRGPQSELALEWLDKPWFASVRGNHEAMAIDWATPMGAAERESVRDIYMRNGGAWNIGNPPAECLRIADAFAALPIVIELETPAGLVGIVHADCPTAHWSRVEPMLTGPAAESFSMMCMWSRDRVDSGYGAGVEGIRAVVVGHTPVQRFTSLGNVLYIDTGAWLPAHRGGGDFTLLDAATLHALKLPKPALEFES